MLLAISGSILAQKNYDTSTPKGLIESLGKVGSPPIDTNPVPSFYDSKSAKAIVGYDDSALASIAAFQDFKGKLKEVFPEKVFSTTDDKIVLRADDEGMTRSFSLSGSIIKTQLMAAGPTDYEFVSADAPDADGLVNVTVKIRGQKTSFPCVIENGNYLMTMDKNSMKSIAGMTGFFQDANELFTGCLKEMNDKTVNNSNFYERLTSWNESYMVIVNKLNSGGY
jgi:hypothetical protein